MNFLIKAALIITAALSGAVEALRGGVAGEDKLPPCPEDSHRRQYLVPGINAGIPTPNEFLNSTRLVRSMEAFATGSGIFKDAPSDCLGVGTAHVTCPGGYLLKDAFTRDGGYPAWRYRINDSDIPRGSELSAFFSIRTAVTDAFESDCCSPTAEVTYIAN